MGGKTSTVSNCANLWVCSGHWLSIWRHVHSFVIKLLYFYVLSIYKSTNYLVNNTVFSNFLLTYLSIYLFVCLFYICVYIFIIHNFSLILYPYLYT